MPFFLFKLLLKITDHLKQKQHKCIWGFLMHCKAENEKHKEEEKWKYKGLPGDEKEGGQGRRLQWGPKHLVGWWVYSLSTWATVVHCPKLFESWTCRFTTFHAMA